VIARNSMSLRLMQAIASPDLIPDWLRSSLRA
jgi:hypothetical protein